MQKTLNPHIPLPFPANDASLPSTAPQDNTFLRKLGAAIACETEGESDEA